MFRTLWMLNIIHNRRIVFQLLIFSQQIPRVILSTTLSILLLILFQTNSFIHFSSLLTSLSCHLCLQHWGFLLTCVKFCRLLYWKGRLQEHILPARLLCFLLLRLFLIWKRPAPGMIGNVLPFGNALHAYYITFWINSISSIACKPYLPFVDIFINLHHLNT